MKILLPVYSAYDANLILESVASYRWLHGTKFKVMHVIQPDASGKSSEESEHEAQELVNSVASELRSKIKASDISSEVSQGQPINEILNVASSWKATIIIMGFRTSSADHPSLAGSVSKAVAVQAQCSVSIIRPLPGSQKASSDSVKTTALEIVGGKESSMSAGEFRLRLAINSPPA